MTSKCAARVLPATLVTVLFASTATAQIARPAADGGPPRLEFALDLFGGWEADLADALVDPDTGNPLGDTSGGIGGVNARLETGYQGEHVTLSVGGHASARYYPAFTEEIVPGYGATLTLASRRERRATWSVSQALSYAPYNALAFLPDSTGSVFAPVVDYQISTAQSLQSDSSATLGYRVSRRGQISFSAGYGIIEDSGEDEFGGLRRWNASGRYTHNAARYLDVYGGYSYSVSEYGDQTSAGRPQPAIGTIEAGVNYARSLSFSRRTTLSFRTGSSGVDYGDSIEYQIVGSVALEHQIGRTWGLRGGYERSLRFVETFAQPALLDTVTFTANGRTSRRTALEAFANYSTGAVGPADAGNDLDTAWASLRFRWALAERMALFAQYFYFQSEFGPLVNLPESLGGEQRRSGIRVGLSLGTTLLGARR